MKRIRVLIASPADMVAERRVVLDLIQQLNRRRFVTRVGLEALRWEDDSVPASGSRGQALLSQQLVDKCDVVVALFWSRFGSPTGMFQSGTEEEIRRAIAQRKRVLVYFSDRKKRISSVDPKQYRLIQRFKTRYSAEGLYWTYKSIPDFRSSLTRHLQNVVQELGALRRGAEPEVGDDREFRDYLDWTHHEMACTCEIRNRRGDTELVRRDIVELKGDCAIGRTNRLTLFLPKRRDFAPPAAKFDRKAHPGRRLIPRIESAKPSVETIGRVPYLRHSWWYEIQPSLSEVGDRVDFKTTYFEKGKNADAFGRSGTQFVVVAQKNVVRISVTLLTGVSDAQFELLGASAAAGTTTIRLLRRQMPVVSADGSAISWNLAVRQPGAYLISYRLRKRRLR